MPFSASETAIHTFSIPFAVRGVRPASDFRAAAASVVSSANPAEKRIHVLLLDDDPLSAWSFRTQLQGRGDFELSVIAASENFASQIDRYKPDAIVMDIGLADPAGSGFAQLMSKESRPLVIFVAADPDDALKAFDLGASDFLLKPLTQERLKVSLTRIRERMLDRRVQSSPTRNQASSRSFGRITVKDRRRTRVIETSDIEWIAAAGDYAELHVAGATHLLREPLSALVGRLPAELFCRIHRSFVVNLGKVSGLKTLRNQDLLVKLKDRTVLRASRTFSDDLRRAVTQRCA